MQIKNAKEALKHCMKCGECQVVCPSFSVTGRESESARGKVRLIKALLDGELKPSKNIVERLSTCHLCKACSSICPSGVSIDKLIIAARVELVNKLGLPLYKKIFFRLLEHPKLIPLGIRCANKFGIFPQNLTSPKKSLKRIISKKVNLRNSNQKVVFFGGCMINYYYPEVGKISVDILKNNGFNVIINDEKCCGIPAKFSGDIKSATVNAKENLKNFTGNEIIVTACPTCALAWKEYPDLFKGKLRKKASKLASSTFEITDFFLKHCNKKVKGIKNKIAYHQPCHLKNGLGKKHDLEGILEFVGEGEYVEIEDRCCGFGGTFSYEHPDLAEKINDSRIDGINESGVDVIVTPCPGCKYFIKAGLSRRGLNKKVLHTVELLSMVDELEG
jgi:glycolate oxidase iron-sulfur subunit|tara:strand:- start:1729 stop:2895 length:1167 start_codon:yes stop_codon:yes gene_type:complete